MIIKEVKQTIQFIMCIDHINHGLFIFNTVILFSNLCSREQFYGCIKMFFYNLIIKLLLTVFKLTQTNQSYSLSDISHVARVDTFIIHVITESL